MTCVAWKSNSPCLPVLCVWSMCPPVLPEAKNSCQSLWLYSAPLRPPLIKPAARLGVSGSKGCKPKTPHEPLKPICTYTRAKSDPRHCLDWIIAGGERGARKGGQGTPWLPLMYSPGRMWITPSLAIFRPSCSTFDSLDCMDSSFRIATLHMYSIASFGSRFVRSLLHILYLSGSHRLISYFRGPQPMH